MVKASAVALVASKAITGVTDIQFLHEGIPGGLGEDGGGSDGQGKPVAFDEGGLGDFEVGEDQVIGEKVVRDQVIRY